jgi:hypothetical protein
VAELRLRLASLFSEASVRRAVCSRLDDAANSARLTLFCSQRAAHALLFSRRRSPISTLLSQATMWGATTKPSNKGMQLTKLSAAPLDDSKCRLMPAPSHSYAGTASQLIPGVGLTVARA